jgi:hypothetical protein
MIIDEFEDSEKRLNRERRQHERAITIDSRNQQRRARQLSKAEKAFRENTTHKKPPSKGRWVDENV